MRLSTTSVCPWSSSHYICANRSETWWTVTVTLSRLCTVDTSRIRILRLKQPMLYVVVRLFCARWGHRLIVSWISISFAASLQLLHSRLFKFQHRSFHRCTVVPPHIIVSCIFSPCTFATFALLVFWPNRGNSACSSFRRTCSKAEWWHRRHDGRLYCRNSHPTLHAPCHT